MALPFYGQKAQSIVMEHVDIDPIIALSVHLAYGPYQKWIVKQILSSYNRYRNILIPKRLHISTMEFILKNHNACAFLCQRHTFYSSSIFNVKTAV